MNGVILEWEGKEHDFNPKNNDWYWALGIISTASAIVSILLVNYLFVVLIIAATVTIALHASKEPILHRFRLTEQGIFIGEELHLFEHMISFSVLEDIEGKLPPMLSIKTDSWLASHFIIPLSGVDADVVYEYFMKHVDEGEHKHTFADVVSHWIGF